VSRLKAWKLFRKGVSALRRGNFVVALKILEEVRRLEPDIPAVYHNMAVAHMCLGDFREAERNLFEALRIDPAYTFALISLANIRLGGGMLREAWAFLSSAAGIYGEKGLPSNMEEIRYFLITYSNLVGKGEVPKEVREGVDSVAEALFSRISLDAPPELLLLKAAFGIKRDMERYEERDVKKRVRMRSAPISKDASLEEALSRYNKYALVGMGKALQLKGALEAAKKADLAKKISSHLRDAEFLRGVVESLRPEEKAALHDLTFKGGFMPWSEFVEKHGSDLDDSIYWNWHPPKTLMGRLKARGLIVEGSFEGKEWVLIPQELRSMLQALCERDA